MRVRPEGWCVATVDMVTQGQRTRVSYAVRRTVREVQWTSKLRVLSEDFPYTIVG